MKLVITALSALSAAALLVTYRSGKKSGKKETIENLRASQLAQTEYDYVLNTSKVCVDLYLSPEEIDAKLLEIEEWRLNEKKAINDMYDELLTNT